MTQPDRRKTFLTDEDILRSLRRSIARRVPEQEVDDLAQATVAEAWQVPDVPADRAGFERWICVKGRSNAIDYLRKRSRRALSASDEDVERCESAGQSSQATYEAREGLRFVGARLAEHAGPTAGDEGPARSGASGPIPTAGHALAASRTRSARWLLLRIRGESFSAIAAADGAAEATVSKSVERLQKQLRAAWIAAAVFAALAIARGLYGRPIDEAGAPNPQRAPRPSVTMPAPSPTEPATTLRERAFTECNAHQWSACLADLDRAAQQDPAGEREPRVQAARAEAERGGR